MTEPTYWDDKIYIIRGDAIELQRHVVSLANDLTFCTQHNALRALEQFDEKARRIYGNVDNAGKASVKAAAGRIKRHPILTVLVGCAIGAVLVSGVLRSKPPHIKALRSAR